MPNVLPSFSALRAFESAARQSSFNLAARELGRTPSAISHQIRLLENLLGTPLFIRDRRKNRVKLTNAGIQYQREISAPLAELLRATEKFKIETTAGVLRIGATPAFISRWLVARLSSFSVLWPDIELKIEQIDQPLSFLDGDVDVLIQYGSAEHEGYRVEPFLTTTRFAVCSPEYAAAHVDLSDPESLARLTLLQDEYGDSWHEWFMAAIGRVPKKIKGPVMPHCELTLRAAKEHQGVVLGYGALIEQELASGELTRIFDIETETRIIYSLNYPESRAKSPRVRAFRDWIFSQVAQNSEERVKEAAE